MDALARILYLRQRVGPSAHVVLNKVDIKDAFRKTRVDSPGGTPVFGRRQGGTSIVDLTSI